MLLMRKYAGDDTVHEKNEMYLLNKAFIECLLCVRYYDKKTTHLTHNLLEMGDRDRSFNQCTLGSKNKWPYLAQKNLPQEGEVWIEIQDE